MFDDFDGQAGTLPSWLTMERGIPGTFQIQGNSDFTRNSGLDGNGNLVITAIKERVVGYPVNYTSAALKSQGKFEQQYGRWSARMNLPTGPGLYCALFLMGSSFTQQPGQWPACGEIDIWESLGNLYGSSVHGTGLDSSIAAPFDPRGGFHDYWLDWQPQHITCGVDDRTTAVWTPQSFTARWPFDDQPMYLYLTLGVTSGAPDAAFPARLVVDSFSYTPLEGDGPLSALSDDEQRELFENVKEIRAQLGPSLPGWPSLGKNAAGQELTWRDAFGVLKADVAAVKKKLLG